MLPTLQILWESARSAAMRPPAKEKLARLLEYEDKVQTQFGLEFCGEMERAWDDLHLEELDRAYEAGFLAAWKLWAEVCSAAPQYRV